MAECRRFREVFECISFPGISQVNRPSPVARDEGCRAFNLISTPNVPVIGDGLALEVVLFCWLAADFDGVTRRSGQGGDHTPNVQFSVVRMRLCASFDKSELRFSLLIRRGTLKKWRNSYNRAKSPR
ncbi:hypothetical protein CDAR_297811 [Caerostris darwini]|uniref:Uncharacterized protein n=1 Tax=Caerostris darwini TaxID=1538125 RepID=A0AAV4T7B9_9ARAC|nr:hypothetical protein CDAR_297811 [Caerostris darwini]